MTKAQTRTCGRCRYFVDDPASLERVLVGLTILSSAYGDTRGDQGICEIHAQLLTPGSTCRRFEPRGEEGNGKTPGQSWPSLAGR